MKTSQVLWLFALYAFSFFAVSSSSSKKRARMISKATGKKTNNGPESKSPAEWKGKLEFLDGFELSDKTCHELHQVTAESIDKILQVFPKKGSKNVLNIVAALSTCMDSISSVGPDPSNELFTALWISYNYITTVMRSREAPFGKKCTLSDDFGSQRLYEENIAPTHYYAQLEGLFKDSRLVCESNDSSCVSLLEALKDPMMLIFQILVAHRMEGFNADEVITEARKFVANLELIVDLVLDSSDPSLSSFGRRIQLTRTTFEGLIGMEECLEEHFEDSLIKIKTIFNEEDEADRREQEDGITIESKQIQLSFAEQKQEYWLNKKTQYVELHEAVKQFSKKGEQTSENYQQVIEKLVDALSHIVCKENNLRQCLSVNSDQLSDITAAFRQLTISQANGKLQTSFHSYDYISIILELLEDQSSVIGKSISDVALQKLLMAIEPLILDAEEFIGKVVMMYKAKTDQRWLKKASPQTLIDSRQVKLGFLLLIQYLLQAHLYPIFYERRADISWAKLIDATEDSNEQPFFETLGYSDPKFIEDAANSVLERNGYIHGDSSKLWIDLDTYAYFQVDQLHSSVISEKQKSALKDVIWKHGCPLVKESITKVFESAARPANGVFDDTYLSLNHDTAVIELYHYFEKKVLRKMKAATHPEPYYTKERLGDACKAVGISFNEYRAIGKLREKRNTIAHPAYDLDTVKKVTAFYENGKNASTFGNEKFLNSPFSEEITFEQLQAELAAEMVDFDEDDDYEGQDSEDDLQ